MISTDRTEYIVLATLESWERARADYTPTDPAVTKDVHDASMRLVGDGMLTEDRYGFATTEKGRAALAEMHTEEE